MKLLVFFLPFFIIISFLRHPPESLFIFSLILYNYQFWSSLSYSIYHCNNYYCHHFFSFYRYFSLFSSWSFFFFVILVLILSIHAELISNAISNSTKTANIIRCFASIFCSFIVSKLSSLVAIYWIFCVFYYGFHFYFCIFFCCSATN